MRCGAAWLIGIDMAHFWRKRAGDGVDREMTELAFDR